MSDEPKKIPTPASFEIVNDYFHAMDESVIKLNEEKGLENAASPYELYLAIKCLEYKFETHQMSAYFAQGIDHALEREKKKDEEKHHDQYR